jgi:hypothetical protein
MFWRKRLIRIEARTAGISLILRGGVKMPLENHFLRIEEVEKIIGAPAKSVGFKILFLDTSKVPRGTNSGFVTVEKGTDDNSYHSFWVTYFYVTAKPFTKATVFVALGNGRFLKWATFHGLEIADSTVVAHFNVALQQDEPRHQIRLHFDRMEI